MSAIRRACSRAATWLMKITRSNSTSANILRCLECPTRNSRWKALAHQTSQGTGGIRVPPGPRYTYYKLADSAPNKPTAAHEADFFDGIDTSLVGLAARLGAEDAKEPFCAQRWNRCRDTSMRRTRRSLLQDPSACAPELVAGSERGARTAGRDLARISRSGPRRACGL